MKGHNQASLVDKTTGKVYDTKSIQEWGDLCGIDQDVINQLNTQADDLNAKLESLVKRAVAAADQSLELPTVLGLVSSEQRYHVRVEFANRYLEPAGYFIDNGVIVKKAFNC